MITDKDEKKAGGKRQGAGRPKLENKKVTLAVRVSPNIKQWIDEQKESAGIVIEKAINKLMAENL